jgi:hypothetical protein
MSNIHDKLDKNILRLKMILVILNYVKMEKEPKWDFNNFKNDILSN